HRYGHTFLLFLRLLRYVSVIAQTKPRVDQFPEELSIRKTNVVNSPIYLVGGDINARPTHGFDDKTIDVAVDAKLLGALASWCTESVPRLVSGSPFILGAEIVDRACLVCGNVDLKPNPAIRHRPQKLRSR